MTPAPITPVLLPPAAPRITTTKADIRLRATVLRRKDTTALRRHRASRCTTRRRDIHRNNRGTIRKIGAVAAAAASAPVFSLRWRAVAVWTFSSS